MSAVIDDLSVADADIFSLFIVKHHARKHDKRNIDLFFLAVDSLLAVFTVGIVDDHFQFAAFACKLGRADSLAVKLIGDTYADGKLG